MAHISKTQSSECPEHTRTPIRTRHTYIQKENPTAGTNQLSSLSALYSVPPISLICPLVSVSVLKSEFRPTTSPSKFSHGSSRVSMWGTVMLLSNLRYADGAARFNTLSSMSTGPGKPPKPLYFMSWAEGGHTPGAVRRPLGNKL
jgi:hypothetical protein